MIKLSKTSKLDGIKSWSLQALDTCPGSKNADGSLVDACSGCYATTGMYNFPNVKAPRLDNKEDWKREDWTTDMIKALKKEKYFRWFDSGDMYALELANKIYTIMEATPHVKHWLPTRMAKFPKFNTILSKMQALPNVMVRFSSDSVMGQYTKEHGSVIVPTLADVNDNMSPCLAYESDGKCNGCRKCYDKEIPVIAYIAHGKKMQKFIKIHAINA